MTAKTLVTGASGFVGSAVVRTLLKHSQAPIKVLVRSQSPLKTLAGLTVELCQGDLRDSKSLEKALEDCDTLYHVAAHYSLWNPNPQEIYQHNVEGTRHLLQAALDKKISKVVYTSTVGVLRASQEGTVYAEDDLADLAKTKSHYKRSKILAEQVALEFVKKGLPLVVVNPSTPVGECDVKPTPTGKMIVDFCKSKIYGYLQTGLNLIDVNDVAMGHLLAAQKGKIGERYILGNKNLSLKEIFDCLASITQISSPQWKVPYPLVYLTALFNEVGSRFTRRPPFFSLEEARLARYYMYFDSSKAVQELGLPQTDIMQPLKRAVQWFREEGYVS